MLDGGTHMNEDRPVDRRGFLKAVGATGAIAGAAAAPLSPALAQAPAAAPAAAATHAHPVPAPAGAASNAMSGWVFFNPDEAEFVKAAVDTIIPADPTGPGALEAGCATYMDRQLAGAFGRGARLYMQGPFVEGTPQQGYQLPLTPADLIRIGIADVNAFALSSRKKLFKDLSPQDRTSVLQEVDTNKAQLANVPAGTWFNQFLNLVMEGYFGDPIYGGNKNKGSWKMIGFPGVPDVYVNIIEEYRNKPYKVEPRGIQDFA
jgi:gluconate 2-dehydrogenase gamma chain